MLPQPHNRLHAVQRLVFLPCSSHLLPCVLVVEAGRMEVAKLVPPAHTEAELQPREGMIGGSGSSGRTVVRHLLWCVLLVEAHLPEVDKLVPPAHTKAELQRVGMHLMLTDDVAIVD